MPNIAKKFTFVSHQSSQPIWIIFTIIWNITSSSAIADSAAKAFDVPKKALIEAASYADIAVGTSYYKFCIVHSLIVCREGLNIQEARFSRSTPWNRRDNNGPNWGPNWCVLRPKIDAFLGLKWRKWGLWKKVTKVPKWGPMWEQWKREGPVRTLRNFRGDQSRYS